MELRSCRVAIGRGDGLIARSGDVVMYVADETASAAPLLAALGAAAGAEFPGRALAKALAVVALGPDSAQIPAFGVLAPTRDGLLVILRGPVTADIESDGRGRRLSGERALTWVDETLSEPIDKITIAGAGSAAAAAGPHTALRAGVVPGGGFTVTKSDTPVAASERGAAQSKAPPAVEVKPPPAEERGQAPPSAEPQTAAASRRGSPVPQPRLQSPRARPPAPVPAAETAMPRPVVGALTFTDEAVYPLDRPYVIGRNPLADRAVRDSLASPIVLPDDPQISRVHAYVTVSAGTVFVRDAGTPGGTFIAAPGAATWTRIGEQPVALRPGWCLRIGARILTYQATGPAE